MTPTSSITGDLLLLVPVLLIAGAATSGFSSLGARISGPLLVVAALPAFLGTALGGLPGRSLLSRLLPHDPTAITLAGTGALLIAIGWGSHLARQHGRSSEAQTLRPTAVEG